MVSKVYLKDDERIESMEDIIQETERKYKSFIKQTIYLRINESEENKIELKDAINRKSLKDGKSGYLIFRLENKEKDATGSERAEVVKEIRLLIHTFQTQLKNFKKEPEIL